MFDSFLLFVSRLYKDVSDLFLHFYSLFKDKKKVCNRLTERFKSSGNFKEFYKNNLSLGLYHFYRGNLSDAEFRFKILSALYRNKPLPAYNLGRCYLFSGDREKAKSIFESILVKGDKEYEEVRFFLNFLSGQHINKIPNFIIKERYEYLAEEYVEKFLIGKQYVGHKLVLEGLKAILGEKLTNTNLSILDLGCGTGVCTHFLKLSGVKGEATGVDISENMLEISKRCLVDGKTIFESIVREDIRSFMGACTKKYDLIIAADSFTHLGDLSSIIPRCVAALNDGGVLTVLVRSSKQQPGADYTFNLAKSGFSYSFDYMKSLGDDPALKNCIIRKCTFKNACEGIIVFYVKGSTTVTQSL